MIGHTQRNCKSRTANCRICAKDHQTQDHIRGQYEKYKCYNCGLDHQANSWRCKKIAEAERKIKLTTATIKQTDNIRMNTTNSKSQETRQRTTPEKKCYACNVEGHIARFCPNKKQEITNNDKSHYKNRGGLKRREPCRNDEPNARYLKVYPSLQMTHATNACVPHATIPSFAPRDSRSDAPTRRWRKFNDFYNFFAF